MRLGMLELYDEKRKFSDDHLMGIMQKALAFQPLNEIFVPSFVGGIKRQSDVLTEGLMVIKIKVQEGLDAICIASETLLPMAPAPIGDKGGFIQTNMHPRVLAHELGHTLGLQHPSPYCNSCQVPCECSVFDYIMTSCGEGNGGFAPHEIKYLRRYLQ